jgi:hypothetical protein
MNLVMKSLVVTPASGVHRCAYATNKAIPSDEGGRAELLI